jgi:hypothetical protein
MKAVETSYEFSYFFGRYIFIRIADMLTFFVLMKWPRAGIAQWYGAELQDG